MHRLKKLTLLAVLFVMPLCAISQESVIAPVYRLPMIWTDDQGKQVSLAKWQGKPVIMTMAYSTCRKFCPMTMARLTQLQRLFDKQSIMAEFVVISYDPSVDKWQTWAQYRKIHDLNRENWHFLTGSLEDTKTVSQLLGMDYWLYDEHVMHNFKIVRLGPKGDIEKTLDWESQEQLDTLVPEVPIH
jgi:protein SCO1/2